MHSTNSNFQSLFLSYKQCLVSILVWCGPWIRIFFRIWIRIQEAKMLRILRIRILCTAIKSTLEKYHRLPNMFDIYRIRIKVFIYNSILIPMGSGLKVHLGALGTWAIFVCTFTTLKKSLLHLWCEEMWISGINIRDKLWCTENLILACRKHFAVWNFFYNLTSYFQLFTTTFSAPNINQSTFGIVWDGIIWTPAFKVF